MTKKIGFVFLFAGLAILLAVLVLAAGGWAQDGPRKPTDTFLKDYDSFVTGSKKLQSKQQKFQSKQQKQADYLNGLSQRLSQQIPAGFTFDANLRMLVPIPKPPAPAPTPAPKTDTPDKK